MAPEDAGESRDVSAEHPNVVQTLMKLAEPIREELGDALTGKTPPALSPASPWAPEAAGESRLFSFVAATWGPPVRL